LRDGSNFINNLKDSNIEIKFNERQELEYSVAKRDIEAGEELTENYADEKAA
jgi:SET domain-containing protein